MSDDIDLYLRTGVVAPGGCVPIDLGADRDRQVLDRHGLGEFIAVAGMFGSTSFVLARCVKCRNYTVIGPGDQADSIAFWNMQGRVCDDCVAAKPEPPRLA
jgi:hypothetical protein